MSRYLTGEVRMLDAAWSAASDGARRRFLSKLLAAASVNLSSRAPTSQLAPTLAKFLKDCVVRSVGDRIQSSVLYGRYRRMCLSLHEEPFSQKRFTQEMKRRGHRTTTSNVVWFVGIKLVTDEVNR